MGWTLAPTCPSAGTPVQRTPVRVMSVKATVIRPPWHWDVKEDPDFPCSGPRPGLRNLTYTMMARAGLLLHRAESRGGVLCGIPKVLT